LIKNIIGNTPLRRNDILSKRYNTNILIKEEFCNPGKSSKDRVAWFMLDDAIKKKKITSKGLFVEASSGNTGISVALFAKELGYKSKIFVSASCSEEKIEILKYYGAGIQVCDNSNGLHDFNSTQYLAQSFAANTPDTYFTNQYYNSNNIKAHYKTTGPELWQQTEGQITHVLIGVGTGGSISGVGRYLKEKNKDVKIWGVEPNNSVYSLFLENIPFPEQEIKFDPIEGIGRTFIPGSFDRHVVDRIFQIGEEESRSMAILHSQESGNLIGFSSAAVLAALDFHVEKMKLKPSDQVVLFFPDHGDRYINKLYSTNEECIHTLNIKKNASV